MKVYLDSCIVIYLLENSGHLNHLVIEKLEQCREEGFGIALSDLVELECLVRPLRTGNLLQVQYLKEFFRKQAHAWCQIDRETFLLAADIRARQGFKLGDSLHLAASVRNGCSLFLTNDKRLSSFTDIQVEALVP